MKSGCNSTPGGRNRVSGHVCGCEEIERNIFQREKTSTSVGQVQTTDCSPTGSPRRPSLVVISSFLLFIFCLLLGGQIKKTVIESIKSGFHSYRFTTRVLNILQLKQYLVYTVFYMVEFTRIHDSY